MFGSTRPEAHGAAVAVYGNWWCGITQMIRRTLDRADVRNDYIDLDDHQDIGRRFRWMVDRGYANRWCTSRPVARAAHPVSSAASSPSPEPHDGV